MAKACVGLYALDKSIGADFGDLLELVQSLERLGVGMVTAHDHVAMGNFGKETYPGTRTGFPGDPADFWPESVALLSAISAVTKTIRLGVCVLVAPLRPAVVLAKQLATLDYISAGRTEIGLGAGWQEAEFQSSAVTFKDRFAYLEEQIQAMRALWTQSPASFKGQMIAFEELFVKPSPVQDPMPLWLGVLNATEKAVDRLGRLASGLYAGHEDPDSLAKIIERIHAACRKHGRDPSKFKVHLELPPFYKVDGSFDLDAVLAPVPDYIKAGVTYVALMPSRFCKSRIEIEEATSRLVALTSS